MKTRPILFGLLITVLLLGCNAAPKLLRNGNYDAAIDQAIKKLRRKPSDPDANRVLLSAYLRSNEQDLNRIAFLHKEGRADRWNEVYKRYQKMNVRQNKIKKLPSTPKGIIYKDYSSEIVTAKQNAVIYFYQKGEIALARSDRFSAREAHDYFKKVEHYDPDYKQVQEHLLNAEALGQSHVLFRVVNRAPYFPLPHTDHQVRAIEVDGLSQNWVQFHSWEKEGLDFDFIMVLKVESFSMTPNLMDTIRKPVTKIVRSPSHRDPDRGDTTAVVATSAPYKETGYTLITINQYKSARISGTLKFLDVASGEVVKTEPVKVERVFENTFGLRNGYTRPPRNERKGHELNEFLPFPRDIDFAMSALSDLKEVAKAVTRENIVCVE